MNANLHYTFVVEIYAKWYLGFEKLLHVEPVTHYIVLVILFKKNMTLLSATSETLVVCLVIKQPFIMNLFPNYSLLSCLIALFFCWVGRKPT